MAESITGDQVRLVKISLKAAQRLVRDSVDKCSGPCKHEIEPDGTCAAGWPSRLMALGVI